MVAANLRWIGCFGVAVLLATSSAAAARKENPSLPLAYTPTTAVAEASAAPTSDMRGVTAALMISDDRAVDDPAVVGGRTDDDDRRSELRATTGVAEFVEASLAKQARDWGFVLADPAEAGVLLVGKITQLRIEETNQAVGASYNAQVAMDFELRDRAGKRLASGNYLGDASRYGKKMSVGNANEVLSDALAEAFASALGDPGLRAAWGGSPSAAAAGGQAAITPEAALAGLERLMQPGFEEAALREYLRGKTLTRALGADDLAAWKQAGVPESVIRAAVTMRVE